MIISDVENGLHVLEATAEQLAARLAHAGERGTAGPDAHSLEQQLEASKSAAAVAPAPDWIDGWYRSAIRKAAHPGRVGGAIHPFLFGVHTTDMVPEDWPALVNAWGTRAGDGACCHFLLGRTEQDGLLQFVPITRNGNHMGGPQHGVIDTASATGIHPNLVVAGIEIHCAGGLRLVRGQWRFIEGGAAHGAPIPASDVIPDPERPGRGWHRVTDYQLAMLRKLYASIQSKLAPLPAGTRARSRGEKPPAFAVMPADSRLVTHVELDPTNRADPWRPTCEWLVRELAR